MSRASDAPGDASPERANADERDRAAEDRRSFNQGTRVTALLQVLSASTTLLTIFVVRLYGDAIWGQFVLAESIGFVAHYVGALGLPRGVLWSISRSRLGDDGEVAHPFRTEGLFGALVMGLGSAILVTALGVALAPFLVGELFGEPDAVATTQIAIAASPFSVGLYIVVFGFIGTRRMGPDATLRGLLVPNITRLLPVVLAPLALGSELLAASWLVANAIAFVAALVLLRGAFRHGEIRNEGFAWPSREVVRYSLGAGAADLASSLLIRIDIWMIAAFLTDSDVGIYGVLISLVVMLRQVRLSVDRPLVPIMGEATARRDVVRVRELLSHAAFMVGSLVGPIVVAILLGGKELVGIYGDRFAEGAPALFILAAGNMVFALFGLGSNVISGAGRGKLLLVNSAVSIVLNTALNALLIPRWGIAGAAAATAFTLGAVAVLEYIMARVVMRGPLLALAAFEPLLVTALGALLAAPVYFGLADDPDDTRIARLATFGVFALVYLPWFVKRATPAFRLGPKPSGGSA